MSSGLLDWFRKERQHDGGGRSLAVIGLGNPGPRYADTRHNAGFMCIDLLASRLGIKLDDKRKTAVLGEGWLDGRRVVLVKPRTFVNRSGEAVKYVLDRHRISPGSLLIVLDDLDLAVGGIRLHDVTGRKTLYGVSGTPFAIEGMDEDEGAAILKELKRHALQERFIYRHKYRVGDIAIYDTTQTLHSGTPIEPAKDERNTRLLWRISVRGKPRVWH